MVCVFRIWFWNNIGTTFHGLEHLFVKVTCAVSRSFKLHDKQTEQWNVVTCCCWRVIRHPPKNMRVNMGRTNMYTLTFRLWKEPSLSFVDFVVLIITLFKRWSLAISGLSLIIVDCHPMNNDFDHSRLIRLVNWNAFDLIWHHLTIFDSKCTGCIWEDFYSHPSPCILGEGPVVSRRCNCKADNEASWVRGTGRTLRRLFASLRVIETFSKAKIARADWTFQTFPEVWSIRQRLR